MKLSDPVLVVTDAAAPKGWFRADDQLVAGWALDANNPDLKVRVEIFVDGESVGVVTADRYDPSVQAKFGGDGHCGFAFLVPDSLPWRDGLVTAANLNTGTWLKTKHPLLTRSNTPTLTVQRLVISEHVDIYGAIESYPRREDLVLEIHACGQQIGPALPLTWIRRKEGTFSVRLTGEALAAAMTSQIEVALPGMQEAGLGVKLDNPPIAAAVRQAPGILIVKLAGSFEAAGQIPVTLRFSPPNQPSVEVQVAVEKSSEGVTSWPEGVPEEGAVVQVVVAGVEVPSSHGRHQNLNIADTRFETANDEARLPWVVSGGVSAERGFFAFSQQFASEFGLSGHYLQLTRVAGDGPLLISQELSLSVPTGTTLVTNFIARAERGASFTLRLRDEEGTIGTTAATGRGLEYWASLRLTCPIERLIVGRLTIEVEASGKNLAQLDVAVTSHGEAADPRTGSSDRPNLLANDGLAFWPAGVGVIHHTSRGEIAEGWRLLNRKSKNSVWTRALMDPTDGSLGLAVAAPEVPDYLRLEADFNGDPRGADALTLKFRAGVPVAARQLLSQHAVSIPKFTQIDRIFILRRTHVTMPDGVSSRDEVAAVIARRITVTWGVERFSFSVPEFQLPEAELLISGQENATSTEQTYILVFEFRRTTVLGLYDVEVVSSEISAEAGDTQLCLEDRNIRLQVPSLKGIEHWTSAGPIVPRPSQSGARKNSLKWAANDPREPIEVIIPVFNALQETIACLEALSTSSTVPILVRIIDDASDAHVRTALNEFAFDKPWVSVHSFDSNQGYTIAADYGLRSAQSSWVVLLNSDTLVTRGWLEGLLACAKSDPTIAFVGPLSNAATYQSVPELHDASGKWKVNSLPSGMRPDDLADVVRRVSTHAYPEVPLLNGFCTLMRRSVFLEVGGLNSGAFPAGYGEENDLCIRVRKSGYRLAVADDTYVYHVKSASFGNVRREELSKKGGLAFRKLHPDVDLRALTTQFRDVPALVSVRAGVALELSKLSQNSPQFEAEEVQVGANELRRAVLSK